MTTPRPMQGREQAIATSHREANPGTKKPEAEDRVPNQAQMPGHLRTRHSRATPCRSFFTPWFPPAFSGKPPGGPAVDEPMMVQYGPSKGTAPCSRSQAAKTLDWMRGPVDGVRQRHGGAYAYHRHG